MKKLIFSILMICILGHIQAQSKADKKAEKQAQYLAELEDTKELVESGNYDFEATWANALRGKRINLTTNPNYIRIRGAKGKLAMPYFGVSHSGTIGLDGNAGINYEGELKDYTVSVIEKKKPKIIVKYSVSTKTEQLKVSMTIFPNKNTSVTINSNLRDSITYDGRLKTPATTD